MFKACVDAVIDHFGTVLRAGRIIGIVEYVCAFRDRPLNRYTYSPAFLRDDVLLVGINGIIDRAHHDVRCIIGFVVGKEIAVTGHSLRITPFGCVHRREITVDSDLAVHAQRIAALYRSIPVVRIGVVAVDEHLALAQVVQHRHLRIDLAADQRVQQEFEGLRIGIAARRNVAIAVGDEVSDEVALIDLVGGKDIVRTRSDARVQFSPERFKRIGKSLLIAADVDFGDDLLHVFGAVDADKEVAAGHQADRERQRQHDTDDLDKFFLHNRICLEFLV